MLHARVLEAYIYFALIYTSDSFLPELPIKYQMNKDSKPTNPFKLVTGRKPSIFHLSMLCCPFVVLKSTVHVGKKALDMRHQAQICLWYLHWNSTASKNYLFCVPNKRKILSSYNVISDGGVIVLWRTPHRYIQNQCLRNL